MIYDSLDRRYVPAISDLGLWDFGIVFELLLLIFGAYGMHLKFLQSGVSRLLLT